MPKHLFICFFIEDVIIESMMRVFTCLLWSCILLVTKLKSCSLLMPDKYLQFLFFCLYIFFCLVAEIKTKWLAGIISLISENHGAFSSIIFYK